MHSSEIRRVVATWAALKLIAKLHHQRGQIMFFQSNACSDSSLPQCYALGDFNLCDSDIYLGSLDGIPFYMDDDQFEHWKHVQLIVDVGPGNGATFSFEKETEQRFLTRSRSFTAEELSLLLMQDELMPA